MLRAGIAYVDELQFMYQKLLKSLVARVMKAEVGTCDKIFAKGKKKISWTHFVR